MTLAAIEAREPEEQIVTIGRSEVLLLEPQTYMNRCGQSVHAACGTLGISVDHLIVVYDDVDLPLGRLRVRCGGSAGGHRGVTSIIEACGAADFARVPFGLPWWGVTFPTAAFAVMLMAIGAPAWLGWAALLATTGLTGWVAWRTLLAARAGAYYRPEL